MNKELKLEPMGNPEYFYRVSEFVTTFGKDKGKNEPFSYFEDFQGSDLRQCKAKAEKHYWERLKGLENGKYFLPFESYENFVYGENAAFSISLSLVEYYTDEEYIEHYLIGEDDEENNEAREIERMVLNDN